MEILENREKWLADFESGWLQHYQDTGETNWKIYTMPRNKEAINGEPIDLAQSKLILITSAGAYLPGRQEAFDAENDLGDYSIRLIPNDTPPDQIAFAHTHYNHAAVDEDQQVLIPIGHLRDLVNEGVIGSLAENTISFMGYQPLATQVVDETIPAVLQAVRDEGADGALLVPA